MKSPLASRLRSLAGMLFALMLVSLPALGQPLVDAQWAAANAGKSGIVFLDLQSGADFQAGHIPGAVNTNYGKDGWRADRADKVPDMLPPKLEPLGELIGKLGIDNATHVVLVPVGATSTDMGAATRVYWTFKVLGHDKVSILDGGMAGYDRDDKRPRAKGAVKPDPKVFKVGVRPEMVITMQDVQKALAAGMLLVDMRPEDQFVGINRHPKATESGTIPGARNLPNTWLFVNAGGQFRNKSQLEQLYTHANVPTTGEQIAFCNTGHWASIGWFVSSELLGNKSVKMYDGSMTEWTILKGGAVEQKVKLL